MTIFVPPHSGARDDDRNNAIAAARVELVRLAPASVLSARATLVSPRDSKESNAASTD